MRLLLKITALILFSQVVVLGGLFVWRSGATPYLRDLLAVDDQCGDDCWFSVPLDGSLPRRDITTRLTDLGAQGLNLRSSFMRFRLKAADSAPPLGTVQISLDDGYARETCFFGRTVTAGDVVAAFGSPTYFWITARSDLVLEAASVVYFEMAYRAPDMVFRGNYRVSRLASRTRFAMDARVEEMCTPIQSGAVGDVFFPPPDAEWRGFFARIG